MLCLQSVKDKYSFKHRKQCRQRKNQDEPLSILFYPIKSKHPFAVIVNILSISYYTTSNYEESESPKSEEPLNLG